MEKEIIILAKSSKHGEYCIAGIDTKTGEWIRPISNNLVHEGSVPLEDITYENGNELQILDKVKIKFTLHSPTKSQPENYIYDSSSYWVKTGNATIEDVVKMRGYDDVEKVFYNTGKEVLEREINGGPSLLLLRVNNPYIFIKTFENQKVQLNFEYNNCNYSYFKISDPQVKRYYASKCDGSHDHREYLDVVFSLTDKHIESGKYYKMVAQIFD